MNLTILSDIEKAVVREIKNLLSDKSDILPLGGEIDTKHSANDNDADMPTINVSITSGEISQPAFGLFQADINIDINIIATSGIEQDKRIYELYPILTAVLFRLTGLTLRDEEGKELPVSQISPNGKFGQINEEENQLAYKISFETSFQFEAYNKEDDSEILGLQLQFFLKPYNNSKIPNSEDLIERKE